MSDPNLHPVHDATDDSLAAPRKGTALCLSGGGYRAMMFHAGCLWRLNQLGLLASLERISSVSGGSILAGVLGMNWNLLGGDEASFVANVIAPIRKMASTTVDEGAILGGIFLPGTISDHVAEKYQKILFGNKTLQDLPDRPRFVINATNVQSGVLMRFSKPYMRDYRVGQILKPVLPLARAVAASSAFPPILSPCEIKVSDYGMKFEPPAVPPVLGEDLNRAPFNTDLVLSDGGVYDNLGLETAWKEYDTVLVSDGGGHFEAEEKPDHDWARHAYRVLNLIDSQVRALRTRQIIELFKIKERKGSYWSMRQPISTYPAPNTLPCPPANSLQLAALATRLQAMDDTLQQRLINWGYAICDASVRSWFSDGLPANPTPAAFPYPNVGV